MEITTGAQVTTPEGYTGTVTSAPALTPSGTVVSVEFDAAYAHVTPTGGADYNVAELTLNEDTESITTGAQVTTPEGYTGTVTSAPALTPSGTVVSVEFDAAYAHVTPTGGADYNVAELTRGH